MGDSLRILAMALALAIPNWAAHAKPALSPAKGRPAAQPNFDLSVYVGKSPWTKVRGISFLHHPSVRALVRTNTPVELHETILDAELNIVADYIQRTSGLIFSDACQPHACASHNWSILVGPGGRGAVCHFDDEVSNFARWYIRRTVVAQTEGWCNSVDNIPPQIVAALTAPEPVAFAAPPPAPPARQPAPQAAKASAKACFERKLDARIAAMGPGQFPPPALAMQWETECAAETGPGAAAPVAEAPRAGPAQTAYWNGQKQTGLVSGQCHYRLEGTEHQVAGLCAHAVSIVVPSRERLTKGGIPSLSFVAGARAPATVFEYSRARRTIERDGVTTITYRALRTHTGTSKLNRPVAFPGKSIDCRYRFARGATTGSLACGITPNTGSFAEAFMLDIRFAPNTPTLTTPVDEGPRLHALMLAAWEALGAQ